MLQSYIKGIGAMAGMIIGAGFFALPYSFYKAGMVWGLVHFAVAFFLVISLSFIYAEISFFTKGKHRLGGYLDIFLGKNAKKFFPLILVSNFGALLVYGILGGIFLNNALNTTSEFVWTLIFFVVASALSLLNFEKIGVINFYLTIPIVGFAFYVLYVAFGSGDMGRIASTTGDGSAFWFLPYGIWLFSLDGVAVIPEIRDMFCKDAYKKLRKIIFISVCIAALVYFAFTLGVLGLSNGSVTEDALSGMRGSLGNIIFVFGSAIGFAAVFTSFIALVGILRAVFLYDYEIKKPIAWLIVVLPAPILFLLGASGLARIISFLGAVGFGLAGTFIVLMSFSLWRKIKNGDPEGVLYLEETKDLPKPKSFLKIIVLFGILAGVVYELWGIFK